MRLQSLAVCLAATVLAACGEAGSVSAPPANEVNLVNGVGGVGRDIRSLPAGTITVPAASRNAADSAGGDIRVAVIPIGRGSWMRARRGNS